MSTSATVSAKVSDEILDQLKILGYCMFEWAVANNRWHIVDDLVKGGFLPTKDTVVTRFFSFEEYAEWAPKNQHFVQAANKVYLVTEGPQIKMKAYFSPKA